MAKSSSQLAVATISLNFNIMRCGSHYRRTGIRNYGRGVGHETICSSEAIWRKDCHSSRIVSIKTIKLNGRANSIGISSRIASYHRHTAGALQVDSSIVNPARC